ncbi:MULTISPECIES: response regulator [Pelosinus]|jgi:DNA-binding NarL/FixJ family response regulator|uniref:Response regulator receiver n=1 Tax=Pelosinus fermentans B4 TaxID=1149862 RepID=I8RH43_9FIRM|nr:MULTISPECIES: response regulator transcription factor [Pelosinus]MBP2657880.1 degU 1 [Bacillota bacterium]EIW17170.1 response regulator receiver [Pelosinus fermentans B4]EIW23031.1 two component transcriptional regulator, LuxR family [Pelosinus fermentans A11]OAM93928.1 two component transcriptional regulator, LuxR family [Pelosinus fermentans DSM 17108]SDQ94691.1 DNA-binding response regulator, NarL/FixJ family, contains REC and HTH domains [Pelosinus fermentans]
MTIKVLVVDDHLLSRKGIISILSSHAMFEIIGEATNGQEALAKAKELMPDLILMDIRMPGGSGLEATRLIKEEMPYVKIVILSVSDDVQDFFEAIKKGAQGYLLKNMEPEYWLDYIISIVQGEAPISREVASKILQEFSIQKTDASGSKLSEREKEVLQLVSQGLGNKEIGKVLFITESTVKNHLRNILDKLHLQNRMQLIAFAYKNGLIS